MSEEIILEARDIWHSYEENDRFSLQGLDLKVKRGVRLLLWEPTVLENLLFSLLQRNFTTTKGRYFVSWKTCELQEKGTSGTSGQGGHRVSGPG